VCANVRAQCGERALVARKVLPDPGALSGLFRVWARRLLCAVDAGVLRHV
jgi:hypothetical protein